VYASANPRIPGFSLIDQSSPQAKNLEVTDECDTIIAIAAAGRHSGLVGGAYEGAAGFGAESPRRVEQLCRALHAYRGRLRIPVMKGRRSD
jgi:hypothetical protein